jgi:hypothetical protein
MKTNFAILALLSVVSAVKVRDPTNPPFLNALLKRYNGG